MTDDPNGLVTRSKVGAPLGVAPLNENAEVPEENLARADENTAGIIGPEDYTRLADAATKGDVEQATQGLATTEYVDEQVAQGVGVPGDGSGAPGAPGDSVQVVNHGTNANLIRPVSKAPVIWVGTVDPAGRIDGDLWLTPGAVPTTPPSTAVLPSGYVHLYEANDATGNQDGAEIGLWLDKAAAAKNFTGTATFRKTNGPSRLVFDGVDDKMDAAVTDVAQPYTKVVLARYVTATASRVLIGGTSGSCNIAATSTGKLSMTNGTTLAHTASVDTNWHLFTAVSNGANSVIAVDDVTVAGQAGAGSQTGLRLAANGTLATYTNVEICLVVVYPGVLDAAGVTAVGEYAKAKYPGTI